ncbi:hypothetical protein VTO42DRAFT_5544 [Malbranchea cinnamomea]
MAEYWKSTPKYWCKHCNTYVRDTPFERNQHEASAKHQAALKRFLRDIHRRKDQEERENQKAKNEVQRLKGLVSGTPTPAPDQQRQQPSSKGTGGGSSSAGVAGVASTSRSTTLEERKRQMAQLAELGVAIPDEFRPELALAGEWREVTKEETTIKGSETLDNPAAIAIGVRKRKFDNRGDHEGDGEGGPRKVWGSEIKRFPGASGADDEELEALLKMTTGAQGKTAVKTEVKSEIGETTVKQEENEGGLEAVPGGKDERAVKNEPGTADAIKSEEETKEPELATIPEATNDAPAVVFKKRKPKQLKR